MEIPEAIDFNGVTYRLMGTRKYYLSQYTKRKDKKRAQGLHVAIYEFYSGKKVPEGFIVHHKDHDSFNNDFSNLECISREQHLKMHAEERSKRPNTLKELAHLAKIREQTAEWHKSPAGRAWHREHAKTSLAKGRIERDFKCISCGKDFKAKFKHAQYCDPNCRARAYRRYKRERSLQFKS